MTQAFKNPNSTSWSAIARRTVERSHVTSVQEREFADEPLTRDEARVEALKYVWQH
jgi:hypothetical protein